MFCSVHCKLSTNSSSTITVLETISECMTQIKIPPVPLIGYFCFILTFCSVQPSSLVIKEGITEFNFHFEYFNQKTIRLC